MIEITALDSYRLLYLRLYGDETPHVSLKCDQRGKGSAALNFNADSNCLQNPLHPLLSLSAKSNCQVNTRNKTRSGAFEYFNDKDGTLLIQLFTASAMHSALPGKKRCRHAQLQDFLFSKQY